MRWALVGLICVCASAFAAQRVVLVGDSTVATEGGWGPAFCALLTPKVRCDDLAANGRSSKSFFDEGLWGKALAAKGDVYLIQFGHNDQKPDAARHTDAATGYASNLRRYVADVKAMGARPVLVSPLSRRNYGADGLVDDGLRQYADAARSVAASEHVAFVDLFGMSQKYLSTKTQAEADELNAMAHEDAAAENGSAAKPDRTHLNELGKTVFGAMVADGLKQEAPELRSLFQASVAESVSFRVGRGERFAKVQAAVDAAPESGAVIRIAPGVYREKIVVRNANVKLIGMGAGPAEVVLSWNDSAGSAGGTSKSASVTATGDGFEAENLTIENTWENEHESRPEGAQAVALLVSGDRSVLDRVRLLGAQDTLYANSNRCRDTKLADAHEQCEASREYFRDCYIEGHVDFIFGDAKAVFEKCDLHPRAHPTVMLTAQSRYFPEEDSGYWFLQCAVSGKDDGSKVLLGRPWRGYSTVTFFQTKFERTIAKEGWADWSDRLKTSTYREYESSGMGVNGGARQVMTPALSAVEREGLNARSLLRGDDGWDPVAAADELRKLTATKGQIE